MPVPLAPPGQGSPLPSLTAGMLQLQGIGLPNAPEVTPKSAGEAASFQQFLNQALEQTAALQKESDARAIAFLSGEADELHALMIAQEKASLAFQFTLQVRNKLVEAYQEVMRMQI